MKCKRIIATLLCAAIPFGTNIFPITVPIAHSASAESMTFEELYALDEKRLEQYCSEHKLKYISKKEAEENLADGRGTSVNIKPNDYLLKGNADLLESEDVNAFNRKNYYDYDFEKMISDLNMPEKYYRFNSEYNDFAYYRKSETDVSGNTKWTYIKLASIYVEPVSSDANDSSIVRLYQLIPVWTQQNPLVYGGATFKFGRSPDSPEEIIKNDNLGDVNSDGCINAVDASSVLTYYACISTNQDGGYTEDQKLAADVNNDRLINAVDASNILAYYAYTSTNNSEKKKSIEDYIQNK